MLLHNKRISRSSRRACRCNHDTSVQRPQEATLTTNPHNEDHLHNQNEELPTRNRVLSAPVRSLSPLLPARLKLQAAHPPTAKQTVPVVENTALQLGVVNVDKEGICSNDINSNSNMSINVNDFAQLIQKVMKPNNHNKSFDINIIPVFDPSQKNQRIESWLAKVNECATIYNWTDEQTRHFALPKLSGYAKQWYQGQQTILLSWSQWQELLANAFPSGSNYGALLTEMLYRRMKVGESIDAYYYEKTALLNACDIQGKKAVDCLIYSIDDRTIRASASSARFTNPEDLLKFLKDMCRESQGATSKYRSGSANASNNLFCFKCDKPGHHSLNCRTNGIHCYNCKDNGHTSAECLKELKICSNCNRLGHVGAQCFRNKVNTSSPTKQSK